MIYFAIPAYNEERTVGVVLWKLRQVMAELGRDYQIIVVDDASTDSTPAVLSPYIRVLPLTVIRNTQRRGYSDSLELAIREVVRRSPYPKRDAVIALQADFTEDPDVVPAMIKRIEAGADIVATDAQIESTAPRSIRWGRRFLRWLLRKPDWAAPGDPLSGLRAYRIVALKRALDARGSTRLLTWDGVGANVELLAQTVPVSRRTDAVETTIKHHRLQRPSRFVFMTAWRDVRGAARGKPNAYARPLPVDSAVVSPLPIAVDTSVPAKKKEREASRRRREPGARPQTAPTRAPRRERSGPKPVKAAPPVAIAAPAVAATDEPQKPSKKRRRSRRRKPKRPQQNTPELVAENAPPTEGLEQTPPEVAANSAEAPPAPKKKSRRGRRGGRGRRRGPRPDANGTETPAESDGEAPPPIAAEGD